MDWRCQHTSEESCAKRVPFQQCSIRCTGSAGCHRRLLIGGSAYGIPRNAKPPSSRTPCTGPHDVTASTYLPFFSGCCGRTSLGRMHTMQVMMMSRIMIPATSVQVSSLTRTIVLVIVWGINAANSILTPHRMMSHQARRWNKDCDKADKKN